MGIQLVAAAQNLEQVLALVDTPVDYIRLGYPYCHPLAELLWPPDKIAQGLAAVAAADKVPQLQWIIASPPSAKSYLEGCLDIVKKFPQTEIVIGHWGCAGLGGGRIKLAACGLGIYNADLVRLLREHGISIISLPLKLDSKQMLAALVNASPADTIFEYQLWGPVMSSHWWWCAPGKGNCEPKLCANPVKFSHQRVELNRRGSSVWFNQGVNNLSRVQELADLGIERGLIQLDDIPPQAMADAIDSIIAGEQPEKYYAT